MDYSLFSARVSSLVALVILFSLSGCYIDLDDDDDNCVSGRGSFETDTYDFSEFSRISNALNADIRITTGRSNHSVSVTAENNILDEIRVRTRGGELILESDRCIQSSDIQIDISVFELTDLFSAGNADIQVTNIWETDDLTINLSGSGTIAAILEVLNTDISISGSGLIDLTGTSTNAEVSIAGSGDYEAFGLKTRNVEVTISGAGNAEIFVEGDLTGAISGSGLINYKGSPESVNVNITGSGRVINRD